MRILRKVLQLLELFHVFLLLLHNLVVDIMSNVDCWEVKFFDLFDEIIGTDEYLVLLESPLRVRVFTDLVDVIGEEDWLEVLFLQWDVLTVLLKCVLTSSQISVHKDVGVPSQLRSSLVLGVG